jgi:hypothetical protein
MKRYVLALIGLMIPAQVLAVELTNYWSCAGFLYCGSSRDAVQIIIGNLIAGVNYFILPLASVVFLYGAIRMITSRGDEGKEAGKKALIYASIGIIIYLLTAGIFRFVCDYIYLLGGDGVTTTGPGICEYWWG